MINAPIYTSWRSARFRVYDDALILRGGVISPDTTGSLNLEASPGAEIIVTTNGEYIAGAVSLVKRGSGTLMMTNKYTTTSGGSAVRDGTLLVAGLDGTLEPNSTNTGTLLRMY